MTTAKGYTEMKDSGIQWIGQIPTHWLLKKAKYCVSITNGSDPKSEGSVPVYGSGSESFKTCGEYKEGPAVLIGRKGATLHIPHYIEGRYWNVDTAFDVKPQEDFSLRYYYYLACVFDYNYYISQTTLPGMTQTNYNNMKLPCPSLDEQTAIASYLDAQCAKIDEIIAQAKASIEDYKQWKASIIYEAVTKGLNPNVEMKDSGVEWIGRMPAHWTAPALKHLCTMQAGKNLISEQISTSGQYPVYGGNGQRGYYSDYNANGNFLLVGRQGALCGNVHYVSGKFWATEHAVVTTPSKITNIRYLYYLLIAMDLNQYASNSAAQPGLSVGNILTVKTLLPPIGEQVRISEFLDNGCPKIDEVITEKQSLIDDLESYKKSLIYEVVTGKRRVY